MESDNIIAEKMIFGGDCIGRKNGKTVFIPFAIPGELLNIEITSSRRDYDTARILNVLKPSPYRIKPVCPLYGVCGGCNMMHIESSCQRNLRIEVLRDCFVREGLEIPDIISLYDKNIGYRCRFQLHDGGLMSRSTNNIVSFEHCPVATDEINDWLASVPQIKRPRGRIHIFGGKCSDPAVVIEHESVLKKTPPIIKNGNRTVKNRTNAYFSGTLLNPDNIVTAQILDRKIKFDVQGFFQSNISVLEKTIGTICKGLSGRNVLDMYSGVGTFSVFLSDIFQKVTLVEHNRDALVFAEMNMAGKLHSSYGISGAKWVAENAGGIIAEAGPFDAVIIDPPRSGMEKEVSTWLCETHPFYIRSVSCDPATHARDAARLVKSGYKLKELYLLDFYPETSHIESLACFEYVS